MQCFHKSDNLKSDISKSDNSKSDISKSDISKSYISKSDISNYRQDSHGSGVSGVLEMIRFVEKSFLNIGSTFWRLPIPMVRVQSRFKIFVFSSIFEPDTTHSWPSIIRPSKIVKKLKTKIVFFFSFKVFNNISSW
jgi:hypothetical protein